jgi:putative transposase
MTSSPAASYKAHRFPAEIITPAVWLYFRFPLSYRQVAEILAARGIVVSYETIHEWGYKFAQTYTNALQRRRCQ